MPSDRPLNLPLSDNSNEIQTYGDVASLVIVGANGSGKSRLGIWIEETQQAERHVHRISAQRALTFEDDVEQRPIQMAENLLLFGDEKKINNKRGHRWGGKPASILLNDYNALLSLLYARERKRNANIIHEIRNGSAHVADTIPDSELDALQKIWADLLPHRKLLATNDSIKAEIAPGSSYMGSEMSDGERVVIYLLGECLCAPENAVLVIDEPEIHLHRAILGRLWDQLEAIRPDCTFIYVTHDLDFAAGRDYAMRVWVDSFDGINWSWEEVQETEDFPNALTLQILGSRKPILFVEGETGSLDKIYRCLFPSHTVIPRGGCFSVIRSVRAMSQPGIFQDRKAFGLIDRDRRSDEELTALQKQGIYSCPVAEIENLLCLPEVLAAAATTLKAEHKANDAIEFAIDQFAKELDRHAVAFAYKNIHFHVGQFEENKIWTKEELATEFANHVANIDVSQVYTEEHDRFTGFVNNKAYIEILRIFNRKGLVNQLADKLGLKPEAYQTWFFETLESERRENKPDGLLSAIKTHLPDVPAM